MKKTLLAFWLCGSLSATAWAQFTPTDTLRFRISLKDKAATRYSLERPEDFLSPKSIERRRRQGIKVDSTDLPVCKDYVEAIRREGVHIVTCAKWENTVVVSCDDSTLIDGIARLPFVRHTERVGRGRTRQTTLRDSIGGTPQTTDSLYGVADRQIKMNNTHRMHLAGFKGEGMTIAVIDAGFHNVDRIESMSNIRIAGTRDFVNPRSDIFAENSHGTGVLSCMAMNRPHLMMGSAPEATYWLLRSEDEYSEYPVEEDYWAAAVEFADSVGVDLVNTSLGYYSFDDASKNYRLRDLDGRRSLMSRQASHVAGKGMVMVCSAGNSGSGVWKKITPPADAMHVLTVGAVSKRGEVAPFSSVGNTADGRIKPDVMAIGMSADVMGTGGYPHRRNGTSFAAPIVCGMAACLWQALPELTAHEIMDLLRRASDRYDFPDNIYGYGIPDLWKAYQYGLLLRP